MQDENDGGTSVITPLLCSALLRLLNVSTQVGEREYRIFVENLNDASNTLSVDIITSVVSTSHHEGLRIETDRGSLLGGGSVLQFDNCYTGMPATRSLRVKNTTGVPMDINLTSDRPAEVRIWPDVASADSQFGLSQHGRNQLPLHRWCS